MKTAVVIEIKKGAALVMKTGGEFTTLPAQKGWQKGDVVTIAEKQRSFKRLYAAAACLVLVLLGTLVGHRLYFTETAIVSVDINPSIELHLNRFDRVIETAFFNQDGEELLLAVDLKNLKSGEAIKALLQSDAILPYLQNNDYLDIAVSGEERLQQQIQNQAQELVSSYEIQLLCQNADAETVAAAHANGMTPGRYLAFLELQELDPDAEIKDYASCGVGQIHKEIEAHHQNRQGQQDGKGAHHGVGSSSSADETSASSGDSSGGHGPKSETGEKHPSQNPGQNPKDGQGEKQHHGEQSRAQSSAHKKQQHR